MVVAKLCHRKSLISMENHLGIGGISFWQILIILVLILILFGGKKIKTMGSDLGESLKGFKKAIKDEDSTKDSESKSDDQ